MYSYDEAFTESCKYFEGDELAAKVFLDKYALRDNNLNLVEASPDQMHRRLAKEFARIEAGKFSNPLSEETIFKLFDRFRYIVPQGSPMFAVGNPYQIVSTSNCFVVESPHDSYAGICKTDSELANISKRRGGVGLDLSTLRPDGSRTHNSALSSTGIGPFMERYSNTIREVGQNSRRGALMETLSIHHPEVLKFITIKNDLSKVTGANISLRLTDEFLQAVCEDTDYELRFPVDAKTPKISKMVKAWDVWDAIIKNAHSMAEPGLLFWDTILRESVANCYSDFGFGDVSTNPCCFSEEQDVWVITKEGKKEIKAVTSLDEVWIQEKSCWSKTSGYFKSGQAEVYRVSFSNGKHLDVTLNHKFVTSVEQPSQWGGVYQEGDFVQVRNLRKGDKIACHNSWVPGLDSTEQYDVYQIYVTITSIEPLGVKTVGCIEVPEYHKFSANGIISGNSELVLCADDSCRLMLLNLLSYVQDPYTKRARLDFDLLKGHAELLQRLMDDLVDLELEAIDRIVAKIKSDPEPYDIKFPELDLWNRIRHKCLKGRRTGSGITALGDMLAALGIPYDSDQAVEITDLVYKELKLSCYRSSVEMAKELGPFPIWNPNLECDNSFITRIKEQDADLYNDMVKYGRRNIALLTTAPAGSVSTLTRTTSGIEPCFMIKYTRRKKGNPGDQNFRSDFVDQNGDHWQEFDVFHPQVLEWAKVHNHSLDKIPVQESPWWNCCADDLDWTQRVRLQSVATKHLDHSVSSTVNLPEDVGIGEVASIYEAAWKSGCKGITVYRKNCRSGVLIEKPSKAASSNRYKKRPKELACDAFSIRCQGQHHFVLVGLMDGTPYEIFAGHNSELVKEIKSGNIQSGSITKVKRGHYRATFDDLVIDSITASDTQSEEALTRMTSVALRHEVPVQFIVEQLSRVEGDMFAFAKSIARALKKYIPDDTKVSGSDCPTCGSAQMSYSSGCATCTSCGYSKCA